MPAISVVNNSKDPHKDLNASRNEISLRDSCFMAAMAPLMIIRVILATLLTLFAWGFAKTALIGTSPNRHLFESPFTGWRKFCQQGIRNVGRVVYFLCGIHWINFQGEQKELDAPSVHIVVAAPHTSYLDSFLCVVMEYGFMARSDLSSAPIFGTIFTALQPVFVDRIDAQSRAKAGAELVERSHPASLWPSVVVFPEGTTSNGNYLFKLKSGAFVPGQPVQLISIHYHSWMTSFQPTVMTRETGRPAWLAMLYIFLQPHISANVTVHGVYRPSEKERNDPHGLFTRNVEKLMSEKLGSPRTNLTYAAKVLGANGIGSESRKPRTKARQRSKAA